MAFDYKFEKITGKEIECSFTGGDISSDGGIVILSEADQKLQLSKQIASIYPDKRNNSKITHTCQKLIQQRLYGIALGYEDLNDHDMLRNCALFQTSLDSTTSLGSSSTLCRLENVADREFIFKSHKLMLELFINSYKTPPREIILDFDATEDEVHGNQENKYYNGYYRHDCFLPNGIKPIKDGNSNTVAFELKKISEGNDRLLTTRHLRDIDENDIYDLIDFAPCRRLGHSMVKRIAQKLKPLEPIISHNHSNPNIA